jgi:formimidoylglutamate deiminase
MRSHWIAGAPITLATLQICNIMSRHKSKEILTLADLWFDLALLPDGWARQVRLTIADGAITKVRKNSTLGSADERHSVALPGICNVHSHGFQRGMAGLAEHRSAGNDNFWSWREVMYRFLDQLNPDDVQAVCAMAYLEMLESGYTRVGEFHYLHHAPNGTPYANRAELAERVLEAARSVGIGMTLLPVFYAHSDFGGLPPKPGQRRFINDMDGFAALVDSTRSKLSSCDVLGIAPHSLRAVTAEELRCLVSMAPGQPIHIHAAEQMKEVEACVAYNNLRPVEWLIDNVEIDERWTLIHATHLSETEVCRLASSKAVAGLCPITEANLGDGIFPAVQYLASGGRIAIGTDSNILIDPAQELRALEYSQRLIHQGRNMLSSDRRASTARRIFEAAVAGGAQSLGVAHGLAEGQPADIVSLNPDNPALYGRTEDALLDSWVFSARNNCIDCVWVAGLKQISGGQHKHSEQIRQGFRKTIERVLAA